MNTDCAIIRVGSWSRASTSQFGHCITRYSGIPTSLRTSKVVYLSAIAEEVENE